MRVHARGRPGGARRYNRPPDPRAPPSTPMSIWFRPYTLEELDRQSRGCMVELVDIRFSEIGPDYLRATMPVDARTWQPFGLLHGGASVVLAETLGSVGANCCVDADRYYCVGQEINANHLRAVRSGRVTGSARTDPPTSIARSTRCPPLHELARRADRRRVRRAEHAAAVPPRAGGPRIASCSTRRAARSATSCSSSTRRSARRCRTTCARRSSRCWRRRGARPAAAADPRRRGDDVIGTLARRAAEPARTC
jgi:1,4-dihydroxy-2-naphthoyl-CoA hydrolase